MPFPASVADAPAQRNKSDAWAKAASKFTLFAMAYVVVSTGRVGLWPCR